MIEACGAQLIRQNKHLVYRLPNGKRLVMSKTPSDQRSILNTISDLKRPGVEE
jgi:hypothetical protein